MTFETYQIEVITRGNDEMINISNRVFDLLKQSKIQKGRIVVFVPHTTAAVTINENADPDVKTDLLFALNKYFPKEKSYVHFEGNSHAHLKSSLVGVEKTIIVENGQMLLGTWQGIYFCEFDGPRHRKVYIQISGE